MQLLGTKRLRDGRQMLPAGGYSEPTENQGIMDMETGEIIALSKKDQRIADAKKNRKEVMAKLQAKVDKDNELQKAIEAGVITVPKLKPVESKFITGKVDENFADSADRVKKLQKWEKTTLAQIKKLPNIDPSFSMKDYDNEFVKIKEKIERAESKYRRYFTDLDMSPLTGHLRQTWEGNRDAVEKRHDRYSIKQDADRYRDQLQRNLRRDREDYTPWTPKGPAR